MILADISRQAADATHRVNGEVNNASKHTESRLMRFLNGLIRLCRALPIVKLFMHAKTEAYFKTGLGSRSVDPHGSDVNPFQSVLPSRIDKDEVLQSKHQEPFVGKESQKTVYISQDGMQDWLSNLRTEESIQAAIFPEDIVQELRRGVGRDCARMQVATGKFFEINGKRYRAVIDITQERGRYEVKTGFMPLDQVDNTIVGNVKTTASKD